MTHPSDPAGRRLLNLLDLARHALAEAHRQARTGLRDEERLLLLGCLHDPERPRDGILYMLGELITDTSRDLPEGAAAEALDEAAGYASDYPADRITRASAILSTPADA
ncbi:hypothetical protein [Streptomyces sp. NPDC012746]|uniref:hypothetical protein n=1 Tax=Streptomyces sp. NPDC012746 TaxID=3364845 RepID=UPI0036B60D5A